MKTVILKDTDNMQLILKTYVDGTIKFIQRWKNFKELNEELFLMKEEVDMLKEELN